MGIYTSLSFLTGPHGRSRLDLLMYSLLVGVFNFVAGQGLVFAIPY